MILLFPVSRFMCFFCTPLAARSPLSVARSWFLFSILDDTESMLPSVTRAGNTMKLGRGGSRFLWLRVKSI